VIRVDRTVAVVDSSQVPGARRVALELAQAAGLNEISSGRAALIATELATNLVKHGNGGVILFGSDTTRRHALTIIAADKGRGVPNVSAALRDGYSTSGTQGTGLGAVKRASVAFDVYSLPDRGTVVLCTVDDGAAQRVSLDAPPRVVVGGVGLPKPPEEENGDAWTAVPGNDVYTVAVVDGLGHGPAASLASSGAVRAILERADQSLERLMEDVHGALRATRGAAVGIARIQASLRRVDFLGVGNIAGTIVTDDGQRKTVSLPGIVGHEMRKLQTFSYPWSANSVLVLHSDGISASWNPSSFPGLMQHDPALIASVLYRDHCRGSDDATVVVAKASA
jgi:anti-sigma regulatory factor (Ser/Thr protein kinase)/serine/threonine protein phosphatase PrpC